MKSIPWTAIFFLMAALSFTWLAIISNQSLNSMDRLSDLLDDSIDPHIFDYLDPQKHQTDIVFKAAITGAAITLILGIIEFYFFRMRKVKTAEQGAAANP